MIALVRRQPVRSLLRVLLVCALPVACGSPGDPASVPAGSSMRDAGYSVLRRVLGDERHLDTLRLARDVVAFQSTSDATKTLIDEIATASSGSLAELDGLAGLEPGISFEAPEADRLGRQVFEALRATAAKELLLSARDDFELKLVLSQIQALRLISHLARELGELDPNTERRKWLQDLAARYDDFYGRAITRLSLAPG